MSVDTKTMSSTALSEYKATKFAIIASWNSSNPLTTVNTTSMSATELALHKT